MPELSFVPQDFMAGDAPDKIAHARSLYRVESVDDLATFDAGYRLLDAEFGALNELERREVLEPWFVLGTRSPPNARVHARYHMALARTPDGDIAGVRDCFTALDALGGRVVVLMSHSLVAPAHRRTGVAALLRAAPVTFARMHAADDGLRDPEILLVLEMEHLRPREEATMVRVLSYLRAGMKVIPSWRVPYAQPDFRDLAALGEPAVPLPFMLLVRLVGHEHRTTIGWDRVISILDGLGAIHTPSVGAAQVAAIRAHALRYQDAWPGDVELLAPDTHDPDDLGLLLEAGARPHYPPEWLTRDATDLDAEFDALAAALAARTR